MRILQIQIYTATDTELYRHSHATDLSSIGYFYRRTVTEHLHFGTKTVLERTKPGLKITVEIKKDFDYMFHAYRSPTAPVAGCIVTDREYPSHIAHMVLRKALDGAILTESKEDKDTAPGYLQLLLEQSQNPTNVDKLTKVQKDLDEIKDVMNTNIELLLARGESLESLAIKSDNLSYLGKTFYNKSRKLNSCCKAF